MPPVSGGDELLSRSRCRPIENERLWLLEQSPGAFFQAAECKRPHSAISPILLLYRPKQRAAMSSGYRHQPPPPPQYGSGHRSFHYSGLEIEQRNKREMEQLQRKIQLHLSEFCAKNCLPPTMESSKLWTYSCTIAACPNGHGTGLRGLSFLSNELVLSTKCLGPEFVVGGLNSIATFVSDLHNMLSPYQLFMKSIHGPFGVEAWSSKNRTTVTSLLDTAIDLILVHPSITGDQYEKQADANAAFEDVLCRLPVGKIFQPVSVRHRDPKLGPRCSAVPKQEKEVKKAQRRRRGGLPSIESVTGQDADTNVYLHVVGSEDNQIVVRSSKMTALQSDLTNAQEKLRAARSEVASTRKELQERGQHLTSVVKERDEAKAAESAANENAVKDAATIAGYESELKQTRERLAKVEEELRAAQSSSKRAASASASTDEPMMPEREAKRIIRGVKGRCLQAIEQLTKELEYVKSAYRHQSQGSYSTMNGNVRMNTTVVAAARNVIRTKHNGAITENDGDGVQGSLCPMLQCLGIDRHNK